MRLASIAALLITLTLTTSPAFSDEAKRFTIGPEGTVIDNKTGLMWATKDNGHDIDFVDAEKYCMNYEAGGFSDWRLPKTKELISLYNPEKKNDKGFGVMTDKIALSNCCLWTSESYMHGTELLSYKTGKRAFAYDTDSNKLRTLPVRRHKAAEKATQETSKKQP